MMVRSMLRAGAWPAFTGVSGAAVAVGGCGVAFPATATVLLPIAFTPARRRSGVRPRRAGQRGLALPWAATGLALAGNVVLGFAVTCVARTRTGEPGAPASAAVVLILTAPTLLPPLARRVSTFPTSGGGGLSSNIVWWTVLAVCVAAVAVSVNGRPLPRWLGGILLTTYAVMSGAVGTGNTMGRDLTS
jgi:hypothetical protein